MLRKPSKSNKNAITSSSSSADEPAMYLGIEHEKTFIDQGSFNKGHKAWILSFRYDYSDNIIVEQKADHII